MPSSASKFIAGLGVVVIATASYLLFGGGEGESVNDGFEREAEPVSSAAPAPATEVEVDSRGTRQLAAAAVETPEDTGIEPPSTIINESKLDELPHDESTWNEFHFRQRFFEKYIESARSAEDPLERVAALKMVSELTIATILDATGHGERSQGRSPMPTNSGSDMGFLFNGRKYRFRDIDFPEYGKVLAEFFRAGDGGEAARAELSDADAQAIFARVNEAYNVLPLLQARNSR